MSTLTTDETGTDTEVTGAAVTATTDEATEARDGIRLDDLNDQPAGGEVQPRAGGRHRHRHRRSDRRSGPLSLLAATARLPLRLGRRLRPSRLPWYGALILGALIVAALVVDGMWWQSNRQAGALDNARGDALVAATSAAQKVASWDYRTLTADIARGRAVATTTGPFLPQYTNNMNSVAKLAGPLKAVAQTTVQSGSVVSASSGKVVVLLFADQAAVLQQPGAKTPETKLVQFRIRLTMVKQHGRWLVDDLKTL